VTDLGSSARPFPAKTDLARVDVQQRGEVTIATIIGEVDISNVDTIAATLTELPNLALGLIVDLAAVQHLDSAGISLLHDLAVRLRRRSQRLVVVCPAAATPRRVLDLTGLAKHSPVLEDLTAAIELLAHA
jgi:anti-anti-sigma factor